MDVLVHQRVEMFRSIHPELATSMEAYGRTYRRWALSQMERRKLISFLVTDALGTPVAGGSIWLKPCQPSARVPGTERPYLMSMYTEPEHRRKGLATLIVKEATKWAISHKYQRLELHASEEGRAVYSRLGFEDTSEMRLDLTKLEHAKN